MYTVDSGFSGDIEDNRIDIHFWMIYGVAQKRGLRLENGLGLPIWDGAVEVGIFTLSLSLRL